jgi:hypothetical protein
VVKISIKNQTLGEVRHEGSMAAVLSEAADDREGCSVPAISETNRVPCPSVVYLEHRRL